MEANWLWVGGVLVCVYFDFGEISMDFSKFSDDNFDVKEWVNSALRIRDDRTPIDVSEVVRTRGTTMKYV